jgi:predicted Zn-dependent protease
MPSVTIPLCEAILAYGREDYGRAREILAERRYDYIVNGASHAQRDVYNQALIECALRGGEWELARALLSARVEEKPHGCGSWLKYAEALEKTGDPKRASAARAEAAKYSVN